MQLFLIACIYFSLFVHSSIISLGLHVGYDSRALSIDGQRRLLIAGCIHYPRSTPDMWPSILEKAKKGGIDVVQTYIFWNIHQMERFGEFDFTGRKDVFKFLRLAQENGLFVTIRPGPYVCAEWNLGGFPNWLREIPGMALRTDNEIFKIEFEKYWRKVVRELSSRKLFADQGGPIIMIQMENEFGNFQWESGLAGARYINWTAELALNMKEVQIPWIMCKQKGISNPIIETCNGYYCDKFQPKSGTPKMWTENWPGWYQSWGDSFPYRPVEDVAFSIARFFARGGSYAAYYMYHGGTNFERTSANNIVTSYDYDVHIDEYGLEHEPKYSHSARLHSVLHRYEDIIMNEDSPPKAIYLGVNIEAHQFRKNDICLTFISNTDSRNDRKLIFEGLSAEVPAWSVSLYDGCTNLTFLYNTAQIISAEVKYRMESVSAGGDFSSLESPTNISQDHLYEYYWRDEPKSLNEDPRHGIVSKSPLEAVNLTSDKTDYTMYSTRIDGPLNQSLLCFKKVFDIFSVFVDNALIGFSNSHKGCFPISTDKSQSYIRVMVSVMGLPHYGYKFDVFSKGILGSVSLDGKQVPGPWTHHAGLLGEEDRLHVSSKVIWNSGVNASPAVWLKAKFDVQSMESPLAIDLSSMSKGFAWINGKGLGRYWNIASKRKACTPCSYKGAYSPFKCHTGCGEVSQRFYHVPRGWVKSSGNTLVLFEELGGDISQVKLVHRERGVICGAASEGRTLELQCSSGQVIQDVEFASYGTPVGRCRQWSIGSCHAQSSLSIVKNLCLGNNYCSIPISNALFSDPCALKMKNLAVQVNCGKPFPEAIA